MADEPIPTPTPTPEVPAVAASVVAPAVPAAPTKEAAVPAKAKESTLLGGEGEEAEADKVEEKKVDEPSDIEVTLPEGFQADEESLKEFKAAAKEAGMKSGDAQKMFDLYVKQTQTQEKAVAEQVKQWREEFTADPGHKKTLASAKRFIVQSADADTRALIEQTYLGNHPGILRLLAKAGDLMRDDNPPDGPSGEAPTVRPFYDHMPK